MAKYDWTKLKQKFITGDYTSLKDFAIKEHIDYGLVRSKAVGWREEKHTKRIQKANKITDKIIDNQVDRAVAANAKHIELWDKLLKLVEKGLGDTLGLEDVSGGDPLHKTMKSIAEVLEKAQKGQRLALEIDKAKDSGSDRLLDMIDRMDTAFNAEGTEQYED